MRQATSRRVKSCVFLSTRGQCQKPSLQVQSVLLMRSRLTSEPVKVIVGISETTYFVDEAHLRASSDFFNKVLDGDWKESATRTVTLSKNMPWDFSIYAKWLYSGCLYMTEPDDRTYDKNLDMTIDKEYNKLNECYELADFLQAIDFKDACVDWIIDKMVAYNEYAFYIAGIIYAHSLKSSPHRQFTIDCALNFWQKGSFELILDKEFPQDFHKDLIHALGLPIRNGFKTVPVKTYFKNIDMCKYHEHTKNNKPCYKVRYPHLS